MYYIFTTLCTMFYKCIYVLFGGHYDTIQIIFCLGFMLCDKCDLLCNIGPY